jgi:monoamine oxidase
MQSEVDIAVVGAGAAGLAAGRVLAEGPASFVVLEARDRVGGRACTQVFGDWALDFGCGWLHSADDNPFAKIAESLGFALDKTPPHWTRHLPRAGFGPQEQAAFGRALGLLEERIEAAAAEGRDLAVAELMEPGGPFNPLLDAFSSYYNGAEFDQISTLDYAAYQDSDVNWRTPAGYGALIAAFGAGAPVILEAPVTRIDRGGPRLRLETPRGTLSASAAIVTLPTPLIADGALAFDPDLPELREAAAAVPLGLADKVFLKLEEPEAFEPESHLFGDPSRSETGSYHLRPFGRPIVEAYLGGRNARDLEAEGKGASTAFVIEELAAGLGSGIRKRLTPIAATGWDAEPFSRGAYSHALPGRADARESLRRPIEGRIFIAGEACSADAFSTAHGAARSGAEAARSALSALSRG